MRAFEFDFLHLINNIQLNNICDTTSQLSDGHFNSNKNAVDEGKKNKM